MREKKQRKMILFQITELQTRHDASRAVNSRQRKLTFVGIVENVISAAKQQFNKWLCCTSRALRIRYACSSP